MIEIESVTASSRTCSSFIWQLMSNEASLFSASCPMPRWRCAEAFAYESSAQTTKKGRPLSPPRKKALKPPLQSPRERKPAGSLALASLTYQRTGGGQRHQPVFCIVCQASIALCRSIRLRVIGSGGRGGTAAETGRIQAAANGKVAQG